MYSQKTHRSRNNTYKYLQVESGSIRLLELLPGTGDQQIACTITHETFKSSYDTEKKDAFCPQYRALSYEWGSPTDAKWIQVGGKFLLIRDNLWRFLRRLRHQTRSIILWVDAICINQCDLAEKTRQVAMMGSIFRCAQDVLAWIGHEGDDSAFLINLALSSRSLDGELGIAQLNVAAERRRTWQALRAFFNRPYWSRTWIIQEIVLAERPILVFCGADVVPYDDLYGMNEMLNMRLNDMTWVKSKCVSSSKKKAELDFVLDSVAEYGRVDLPTLLSYGTTYGPYGPIKPSPGSLKSLIYKYAHTVCLDPRDKVFALLEMADDVDLLQPPSWFDYSKDFHNVFFEVLAYCTPDGESLAGLGKVLMESMNLSSESLRGYIWSIEVGHATAKISLPRLLDVRLPIHFGRGVSVKKDPFGSHRSLTVTCIQPYVGSNGDNVLLFEIDFQNKGRYEEAGPLTRGIAYNIQCGDEIIHVDGSDVALVVRTNGNTLCAVSWALLELQQRNPSTMPFGRLRYLQRDPFHDLAFTQNSSDISYHAQFLFTVSLPLLVTVFEGAATIIRAKSMKHDSELSLPSLPGPPRSRPQLWRDIYRYYMKKRYEWSGSWLWHVFVMPNINKYYKEARGLQ